MINLKIKTNGTVRNLTLPYPGQSIPDIIEKNSVVTVSEVTEPESLKYMEGHEWNIEEINFLAKRMESFDKREKRQFDAIASQLKPSTGQDLINQTFNLSRYTLISDFSSLTEIGKTHIINRKQANERETGTIVIWEDFDIIRESSGNEYAELMEYQSEVSNYLSLIFHRYLNKPGANRLTIRINEFDLKGLDPFLENHPKTTSRLPFSIVIKDKTGAEQKMTVQVFVLPFQKDLSPEDKKNSGGIENYRSKQGFYIYRNERLIVWGTWFGRQRDELTKYARIRVDIPNTLDEIWGIDINHGSKVLEGNVRAFLGTSGCRKVLIFLHIPSRVKTSPMSELFTATIKE